MIRVGGTAGLLACLLAARLGEGPAAGDRGPGLEHAASSAEELVAEVLAAVTAGDLERLTLLRIDAREHAELLWPHFPARHHNVQLDFAWDMLHTRSHTNARRAISTWAGRPLEPVEIRFTRGEERYPGFTLHRGTHVKAVSPDGTELELRFLGSLVELGGGWKVLSYKD